MKILISAILSLSLPAHADRADQIVADGSKFMRSWEACFKKQGDPRLNCAMDVGFKVERYFEDQIAELKRFAAAKPNGAKLTELLQNIDLPTYRQYHCEFEEEMESGEVHERRMQQERCRFRLHFDAIILLNNMMGL